MIEAGHIDAIAAADVRTSDGAKVGAIGQVFLDAQTGRPEWAAVRTGLFGTRESFVPLRNAEWDGRAVHIAYDRDRVKNAPHVDPDSRGLAPDQQVELYTYYGFTESPSQPPPAASSEAPSVSASSTSPTADHTDTATGVTAVPTNREPEPAHGGEAVDGTDSRTEADTNDLGLITRSEERIEVDVQRHATERVRLYKHVVTEEETVTVTVRREQLRIERVPISAAEAATMGAGQSVRETETEIILYEERPVVTTVSRPVERIRLTRESIAEEETVTAEVRRERIEMGDSDSNQR